MRLLELARCRTTYTSNAYLVRGTWNALDDVNTLVDTGSDPCILDALEQVNTGVGKHRLDMIVLTHSHSDHTALLPEMVKRYTPEVCAYSRSFSGATRYIRNFDMLHMGDRDFEVIHMPGHSADSVCLYCAEEKLLFSGDSPVFVTSPDSRYSEPFVQALRKLCDRDIQTVYPGHGEPVSEGVPRRLRASLALVEASMEVRA